VLGSNPIEAFFPAFSDLLCCFLVLLAPLFKVSMPNNSPVPGKTLTRQNSTSFTLLDIQKLIAESEQRVVAHVNKKFEALSTKIDNLEASITAIKAVQAQQETDISNIKEVVVQQQLQIEAFEDRERRCNLIISNLPESDVTFKNSTLSSDADKVKALIGEIVPETEGVNPGDVLEVTRIGRPGKFPRIVKLRLPDMNCRNKILRSSKGLNSPGVQQSFGRLFVNKDMSYLRRLEEKRLRVRSKELSAQYPGQVRLRNGKLFLGPAIRDSVDFRNQLF
jgi:hypothetical protein